MPRLIGQLQAAGGLLPGIEHWVYLCILEAQNANSYGKNKYGVPISGFAIYDGTVVYF